MNKEILIVVGIVAVLYFMNKKDDKPTTTKTTKAKAPAAAEPKQKGRLTDEQKGKIREFISHIDPEKLRTKFQELKDKWKGPEHAGALNLIENEINNVA